MKIDLKKITDQPAWVYSLFLHVFFLSVLALLGLPTKDAESSLSFSLVFQEERLEEELDVLQIEPVEFTQEAGSIDTQVDVPLENINLEVKTPDYIAEDEMVSFLLEDPIDYAIRLEPSSQTSSPVETEHPGMALASGTGTGEGSGGDGDGRGGVYKPYVRFFGTLVPAQDVVYVLDFSISMRVKVNHGREGYMRIQLLREEARKSILALEEGQGFNVVIYHKGFHEMDDRGIKPATSRNKREAIKWLHGEELGPITQPRPALQRALELKPDAVFFLTDGVFGSITVDLVTDMNVNKIPIHTVGIGDSSDVEALQRLADLNGGYFRSFSNF